MAKSKAVGDPAKAGKYTSAGRRAWLLFISSGLVGRSSPSFSRSGRRPALWHQVCTKSRTAWCLCVRSPPATHIPAWWLLWSRTASHKGHHVSEAASGTWRRTRSSDKNAAGSIWVRPLGTASKKALPPTDASERSVARPVMVLWASCVSQAARSIIWDKAFCLWPRAVSRRMAWLAGSWALKAARAARTSGQAFASSREKVASSSAAEVRVDAQDARKAAAACWEVDRSPSPPWARPNDACCHCAAVRCKPVKFPKLRRSMPSNMSRAMVCAVTGLQRMLWSIRANPAQARRSRKATCGSSNSPKESRRSPALAARSAVWARTKAASPTAAPKSSKSRCTTWGHNANSRSPTGWYPK